MSDFINRKRSGLPVAFMSDWAAGESKPDFATGLLQDSKQHKGQGEGAEIPNDLLKTQSFSSLQTSNSLTRIVHNSIFAGSTEESKHLDVLYKPKHEMRTDSAENVTPLRAIDSFECSTHLDLRRRPSKYYPSFKIMNTLSSDAGLHGRVLFSESASKSPITESGLSRPSLEWDFEADDYIKSTHTQTTIASITIKVDASTSRAFPEDDRIQLTPRLDEQTQTKLAESVESPEPHLAESPNEECLQSSNERPLRTVECTGSRPALGEELRLERDGAHSQKHAGGDMVPAATVRKLTSVTKLLEKPGLLVQPTEGVTTRLSTSFEICNGTAFLQGYKVSVNAFGRHLKVSPRMGLLHPHSQARISVKTDSNSFKAENLSKYLFTVEAFRCHCTDPAQLRIYYEKLKEQHPEAIERLTVDRMLIWDPRPVQYEIWMTNSIDRLSQQQEEATLRSASARKLQIMAELGNGYADGNKNVVEIYEELRFTRNSLLLATHLITLMVAVFIIIPTMASKPAQGPSVPVSTINAAVEESPIVSDAMTPYHQYVASYYLNQLRFIFKGLFS